MPWSVLLALSALSTAGALLSTLASGYAIALSFGVALSLATLLRWEYHGTARAIGVVFFSSALALPWTLLWTSEQTSRKEILLLVLGPLYGSLGILWAFLLRRSWTVETPLWASEREAELRTIELCRGASQEARRRVRRSIEIAGAAALFALGAGLLRWGFFPEGIPLLSHPFLRITLPFLPLLVAVGWFLGRRTSMVLAFGSLAVGVILAPVAILLNVPYSPASSGLREVVESGGEGWTLAHEGPLRIWSVGSLLGGAVILLFLGILRLPPFRWDDPIFVPGKGWRDPPRALLALSLILCVFGTSAFLWDSGTTFVLAIAFGVLLPLLSLLLCALLFHLPSRDRGTIVASLVLAGVLLEILGERGVVSALALVGIVGGAFSVVLQNLSTSLYLEIGPWRMGKDALVSLLVASLTSFLLLPHLSTLGLPHPVGAGLGALGKISNPSDLLLLLVGGGAGALLEISSLGAFPFGVGALLPPGYALLILSGGILRSLQERSLGRTPLPDRFARLLDGLLVAAGIFVGDGVILLLQALRGGG